MIILAPTELAPTETSGTGQPARVIALFGTGLIGGTLLANLLKSGWQQICQLDFSWNDKSCQAAELTAIFEALAHCLKVSSVDDRLDIVWSAGKAGFAASSPQLLAEDDTFKRVVDAANAFAGTFVDLKLHFHLMSSAGGLFEGQTFVDEYSQPAPFRPYGESKMRQENIVIACDRFQHHIYRPTSVYGYTQGGRIGLISALLSNMISGRVTQIYGSPHTVRDFVLADDIARHVKKRIEENAQGSTVELLGSGKPTCLSEVFSRLQLVSGRPLYLNFDAAPQNSANNSFRKSVLPKGFNATDLSVGIRQTLARLQARDR